MRNNHFAHIFIDQNKKIHYQTLRDHNRNTARYASECLSLIGLKSCGMLAGILHDGKGTDKFQDYIKTASEWDAYEKGYGDKPDRKVSRGSVNHTFAGVIYLLDKYHDKKDFYSCITSEIIACAIGSHHGLFDCQDLDGNNGFIHRVKETDREVIQYSQAKESFENEISSEKEIDQLFQKSKSEIQSLLNQISDVLNNNNQNDLDNIFMEISLLERMLTSALIYADRRDTAEFMSSDSYPDIEPDWSRDIQIFEEKYSHLNAGGSSKSLINSVRKGISDQCVSFAEKPEGIYRMDVPTGGGKTLTSLRYALYHAKKYKKNKIIYVIPLLTIIDQNAEDLKEYLPEETVLEHHSDVAREKMNMDELKQYDLIRDRWTAPVIITTLVQILDILFSSKTSAIARMRALSNSVIIFDEVQSVPIKTLALFDSAINFLSNICHSTVILCSATQPEFEALQHYPMYVNHDKMVTLNQTQEAVFKRQKYHEETDNELTIDELAEQAVDIVSDKNPLMIVCNTKSEAKNLFDLLSKKEINVMHLSAGMCKAHRKEIINAIKEKLRRIQNGETEERFILVTTQLVEAGVNFSFRSVIRVLAGNDNLVQTGGRCNRSNEYGAGDVYLVRLNGENVKLRNLPDIQRAQSSMVNTIERFKNKGDFTPESEDFIRSYYTGLYVEADNDGETLYKFTPKRHSETSMTSLLSNDLKNDTKDYILAQPFKTTGDYFSVFDDNTYEVIVPYKKGADIIDRIKALSNDIPKALFKEASDYTVSIYEWQKQKLEENGMISSIGDGMIYLLEPEAYGDSGIIVDAEFSTNDLII